MSVTAAKFEQKGDAYVAKASNKQSKKKRLEKQEKNLGWGGHDDMVKREQLTVVLKHMFTQEEFQESPPAHISQPLNFSLSALTPTKTFLSLPNSVSCSLPTRAERRAAGSHGFARLPKRT